MTTTTTGRAVDAGTVKALKMSYANMVRWGTDSVRSSWRFGQTIDSFTDSYTMAQLADAMDLSTSTLNRYARFYRAFQRPDLALQVAERLETFNIDTIFELRNQLGPVERHTLQGRRFRYRCNHCQSTDVARVEYDPATGAEVEVDDE